MTFKEQILQGIPSELPAKRDYKEGLNRAPRRKDILSVEEKQLAVYRYGISYLILFLIASIISLGYNGYHLLSDPEPWQWKKILITFLPFLLAVGCIWACYHLSWKKYQISSDDD